MIHAKFHTEIKSHFCQLLDGAGERRVTVEKENTAIEKYFEEWNVEVVNKHLQCVKPHTVELTDRTGNKVVYTYNISPYEWIYKEYMRRYSKYKSFKIDSGAFLPMVGIIVSFFCLGFINYIITLCGIGLMLLTFGGIFNEKEEADKALKEFETQLAMGELPPDWEKSLEEYYKENDIYISVANFFLQMRHMDILEIKIIDLIPGKRLSVKRIEKNGDVYEKFLDFNSFNNINIEVPTVIMIPESIKIKLPIDINKTGETDNQVQLTHED